MSLSSFQIGKDLRGVLHKMWWCVRLLRSYNINRDINICGVQYHKFIFDRIIESFAHYLIIQLCASIDVKNKKGATFTIWINKLLDEEKDPNNLQILIKINEEYNTFCLSPIYQGIKERRDKAYAHMDQDRHEAFTLPGNTYGDLFKSVEKLMNIYDKIALLGKISITVWSGSPDRKLYNTVANNIVK